MSCFTKFFLVLTVVLLAYTPGQAAHADILTGMTGYYKMEGNLNDWYGSVNGVNHGVVFGSQFGKLGQGAGFNGSSLWGDLGMSLAATSSFSVGGWFFSTSTANQYAVAREDSNGNMNYYLTVASNGITFGLAHGYGSYWSTSGAGTSVMTYVVGTWDGSILSLYENGALVSTTSAASTVNITGSTTIGYRGFSDGNWYRGGIDELGFWNKALSVAEVNQLYQLPLGNTMCTTTFSTTTIVQASTTIQVVAAPGIEFACGVIILLLAAGLAVKLWS